MMYTRTELDRAGTADCRIPNCDHKRHDSIIDFRGRCHPAAYVKATYRRLAGVLRIECSVCNKVIAEIPVER